MKVKTSVSLERGILRRIDRIARTTNESRSALIEQAVVELIDRRGRSERDARDRTILDQAAAELNGEMEDVLSYQAEP